MIYIFKNHLIILKYLILKKGPVKPEEVWNNGVGVIEYYNKAKEFIFRRVRCNDKGTYQQSEFGFYTVEKVEVVEN